VRFRRELNTQVRVYKLERLTHAKYKKQSVVGLGSLLT